MTITAPGEVVTGEVVRTDDEWAEIIRAEMARTAESIVLTGQYLIAAKADVAHGAWLPMLRKIGISDGYARKMMSIAGSGGISNRLSSNDLPSSVDALYQLSRLAPEAIESGIESGDVHPGMTIKDAKGYAQEVTERDTPANVNTETGEIYATEGEARAADRDQLRSDRADSGRFDLALSTIEWLADPHIAETHRRIHRLIGVDPGIQGSRHNPETLHRIARILDDYATSLETQP